MNALKKTLKKGGGRLFLGKYVMLGAVLFLLALMLAAGCGSEEAYRRIQVYQVDGSATVEREQTGALDAYANMQLQSGDMLMVDEDSYVYLELDEDKFVLLEPGTHLRIEAEGDETDSKTRLYLEQGAIVNCIETPLTDNSYYEIQTPNATMAVRGTIFRIGLELDAEGNPTTDVAVFEGEVECFATEDAGATAIVLLPSGNKVRIGADGQQQGEVESLLPEDYDSLLQNVLEFLTDNGVDLPVSSQPDEGSADTGQDEAEHVHDENCGYSEATACGHIHNANCGYAIAIAGSACTHTHDADCGYSPATPGSPCTHFDHDGACGGTEELIAIPCDHTEHNAYCGYVAGVAGVPCDHYDHDGDCGFFGEDGVCKHEQGIHDGTCSYVQEVLAVPCSHENGVHDWTCSYQEAEPASPCGHTLGIHDEYCGYVAPFAGTLCLHSHDNACGYVAAVAAHECTHVCPEDNCGYSPGSPCRYSE
ncbi:MAG: FecR family protein [Clostridia bacterium]|nr:FecR family protein [Clostridia bacterium]